MIIYSVQYYIFYFQIIPLLKRDHLIRGILYFLFWNSSPYSRFITFSYTRTIPISSYTIYSNDYSIYLSLKGEHNDYLSLPIVSFKDCMWPFNMWLSLTCNITSCSLVVIATAGICPCFLALETWLSKSLVFFLSFFTSSSKPSTYSEVMQ